MAEIVVDGARISFSADGPPGKPALLFSNALGTVIWLVVSPAVSAGRLASHDDSDWRFHGWRKPPLCIKLMLLVCSECWLTAMIL
jgi:hypothetical protein